MSYKTFILTGQQLHPVRVNADVRWKLPYWVNWCVSPR